MTQLTWIEHIIVNIRKIAYGQSWAIPPLGCGCGGLNWKDVCRIIRTELGQIDGTEFWLYGENC